MSGLRDEVEALRMAFDKGNLFFSRQFIDGHLKERHWLTDGSKTNLDSSSWDDINVVAGVLKLYFRLLPIPLIAFQVYPSIMAAASKIPLFFSHAQTVKCQRLINSCV